MKVLVVIDMQNDFINGTLGTPEAEAIVDRVVEEIGRYPAGDVIATRDTHPENYLETQEGRILPVAHCIQGTAGWRVAPAVHEALTERAGRSLSVLYLTKSTFGSRDLAQQLLELHRETPIEAVELAGLCTDICVISNALVLKAFLPEVPIRVDAACCAGVSPEGHKNALEAMKMCQIGIVNE